MKRLFTSEAVTEGHPDKLCDRISDSVLDAVLVRDPEAHVACECYATTGLLVVGGEISSKENVDIQAIARKAICEVGYNTPEAGIDGNTCAIIVCMDKQSPDIAMGVNSASDNSKDIGAGDQGMMFGYACDETYDLMPLPITLANKMAWELAQARKDGRIPYILPDGKTQVTVEYNEKGAPIKIDTIVVSTQHTEETKILDLRADIIKWVIQPVLAEELGGSGVDIENYRLLVNPTGRFVKGGPAADTGLTGRKIIVDTYGGYARHGGGAFSGKDPTKVDRSAAYAARYVAKNIVAANLASKCEVQIAYAIGVAEPVSVRIDTFGTGRIPQEKLEQIVKECFDLRPAAIIKKLNLRNPIYTETSSYGHFGNPCGISYDILVYKRPWESIDMADKLSGLACK